MTKFTSFLLLAAIASFSAAAPVATTTTATEFVTVTATAPIATPTLEKTEEPLVTAAAADIYTSSIKYKGKATWFTDSYGSCGVNWDGNSEPIVALSAQMMGAQSWGHPACNKKVRIALRDNPSKTVIARVVDKCPGDQCDYGSLDLSPAAFKQLSHLDTGILNIEWNFV
ncbi:hypothetical protein CPC16_004390 [Podila verticillata]|nr:hypothetical protein CPC16_004390 [Podila verticillata]KAI9239908.1 MAG: RlpA-like double-psi beta-barrel-protein domain-containing protein-containing protein [Podila humilis]KFH72723.1 hypothetical protein MVEG_03012 [Podila verticillata NRRL 6337]